MSTLTTHRPGRHRVFSAWSRLLCCALLLAVTVGTNAAPGTAQGSSPLPILLTDVNGSWVEGRSQWLSLAWTSQRDLENVEVRASSPDLDVLIAYPTDTLDHTTLSSDPTLAANEVDTSMLFVSTTTATPRSWRLDLTVSWEADGQRRQGSATIWFDSMTVDPDTPFVAITNDVTVPSTGDGARNWVELDYLGVSAVAGDFEVSLEGVLPVHYPQDLFSSLHHDAVLNPDEIDTARMWFDPQRLEAGVYEMVVTVEYVVPGDRAVRSLTHPLTVTVI